MSVNLKTPASAQSDTQPGYKPWPVRLRTWVRRHPATIALTAVIAVLTAASSVIPQLGITPQTALRYGVEYAAMLSGGAQVPAEMKDALVGEARRLEEAGASLLDFTNSGPVVGPAVVSAVAIPVIGGLGGGPWLDGRMRMAHAAIGYGASVLDAPVETYADVPVARITLDALTAYAEDVRAGRPIKGAKPLA